MSDELAAARRVPVRLVGAGYLLALALAVSMSAVTIGAILSTALLIGPAAVALRVANRIGVAIAIAMRGRRVRLLGGDVDRVRQHRLGRRERLAGQLLHRGGHFRLLFRLRGRRPPSGGSAREDERTAQRTPIQPAETSLMFASFMINAWEAGTVVAIVAGVVGFFTVLRGAAFAAHSLPNGAFAGAAGAFLIGANTIVGLGVFSLAGAGMIAGLGRRARSDVATALTIVLMLALGDLFLSRTSEYAPEIFALLFGEVLGVSSSKLAPTVVIAAVCIVAVVVLYRPLMLSSVTPDVAAARGINPRLMDLAFLIVVALVTTMAVPVVGSLLIFSLLIGPPAAARSFTNSPLIAIGLSVVFALRHGVAGDRRLLRDESSHRLLRRRHERVRLRRRASMDRLAAGQQEAAAWSRRPTSTRRGVGHVRSGPSVPRSSSARRGGNRRRPTPR